MQKRKIMLMVVALVFLVGCANTMRGYVSGRTILNDYWEQYLDFRDSLPDGAQKTALRAKFNDTGKGSYFTDAKDALDVWKGALGTTGEIDAGKLYYKLLEKVVTILQSEGIVVIK